MMNSSNPGGRPIGGGQGRASGGRGRMGGPKAGGALGICRCPGCGYSRPHERGVPCMRIKCPQCGTNMMRE